MSIDANQRGDGAPAQDSAAAADRNAPATEAARVLQSAFQEAPLPPPTESMRLLSAAQGGDRAALESLLQRYEARLQRIIRIRISARLRQSVESVDVLQETWRSAVQHLDGLEIREPAGILRWLARIAENHMLDVNRRLSAERRDRRREVPLPDPADSTRAAGELPAPGKTPAENASERELRRIVDEAVAELPDDYREVIVLRTYHGGSWEFVARSMGSPSSEAARLLHRRARIRLGRMLRDRLGGTLPTEE